MTEKKGFTNRQLIPKIVNNFESKTLNQKIFYDILSEEDTQLILCHGIQNWKNICINL